eukprot:5858268-Prymnesium_polylepis.1
MTPPEGQKAQAQKAQAQAPSAQAPTRALGRAPYAHCTASCMFTLPRWGNTIAYARDCTAEHACRVIFTAEQLKPAL